MTNSIPRYLILILSMFNKNSGSENEYYQAIKFLPENMPLKDYREAIEVIREYIGIEKRATGNYQEYLLSGWWQSRKAQAVRGAGYKCQLCGAMGRLECHHLDYSRLGNEQPEDLQVLCRKCHREYHHKEGDKLCKN